MSAFSKRVHEARRAKTSDDDTAGTDDHNMRVWDGKPGTTRFLLREVTDRIVAEGGEIITEQPTEALKAERAARGFRDHGEEIEAALDGTHPGFVRDRS